jgi:hypothetical protein
VLTGVQWCCHGGGELIRHPGGLNHSNLLF